MAVDPANRYATPRALADDVDRWIANEPVTAYPEPFTRRARRWARKHRTALATAASAAMVAALLLGGVTWLRVARRQTIDDSARVAMGQAEGLAIEARARGELPLWEKAIAEAVRAQDRLESGDGSPALRLEVVARLEALRSEHDRLRQAADARRREDQVVIDLEEARIRATNVKDGGWDTPAKLDAYLAAFRSCGIDVAVLPVAEAAARIRSSRIADDLIAALDNWTIYVDILVPREKLVAITRAADVDPRRAAIREAVARRDAAGLRRLCEHEEDRRNLGPGVRSVFEALLRLDPAGSFPLLEAIRRESPSDFWINHNLGVAYLNASPPRSPEAVRCLSIALALRPVSPGVHLNLGLALRAQGDLSGAIAEYRQAIRIKPDYAGAHNNLGGALMAQSDLSGAIDEYRQAIRLKPDLAEAHCNLGLLQQGRGLFAEALSSLERGHELGSKRPDWGYPSAQWVNECRRLVELEAKLPAILKGSVPPKDAGERLILADLCYKKMRYDASARFFGEAFAERPALADDLAIGSRYDAACSASLAGSGRGKDDPMPDEAARVSLRGRALSWLRDDLAAWGKVLDGGNEPARKQAVIRTLDHRKADADLAGIRDEEALAKLPEAEREAFRSLWADVEALRKKAEAGGGGAR